MLSARSPRFIKWNDNLSCLFYLSLKDKTILNFAIILFSKKEENPKIWIIQILISSFILATSRFKFSIEIMSISFPSFLLLLLSFPIAQHTFLNPPRFRFHSLLASFAISIDQVSIESWFPSWWTSKNGSSSMVSIPGKMERTFRFRYNIWTTAIYKLSIITICSDGSTRLLHDV